VKSLNQTGLQVAWVSGRVGYPNHSLTVMIKGTFRLQPNGIPTLVEAGEALLVDGDRHIGDDTQKSLEYATDFAFYKPQTDLLFKGSCYVPDGKTEELCKVSFGIKGEQQILYVFGDRQWQNSMFGGKEPGKTTPFSQMPLCYENSFGGEGFEANPVGKGVNNESMPNIEHPDHLIMSPNDRPQPVGFAPIHSLWQPRKAKMGTFDKNWEEQRWPWFPADMDWSIFNAASPALQRAGYLKGDETLVMENLHPRISNYSCQLPALRSRCFINADDPDNVADFKEVPLNLDTLWVDADEELLVLVWRGVTPINDRFHDELKHLLLVTEPLASEPQAEQVYRDQLKAELKALQPVVDIPVAPVSEPATPAEENLNVDSEIKKKLDEVRASLKGMNLPEATMDALNKEQDPVTFAEMLMKSLGASPEDFENVQKEAFLNKRQMLDEHGYDPNMAGRLSVERIESRDDVIRYHAEGRDFSGADMSSLDLRGLDLQNAEFGRALLVNTNLQSANLSGANLSYATLDGANLSDAMLENVNLTWASLDKSNLARATLASANLSQARLVGADLTAADLSLAKLHMAQLNQSLLKDANLTGADLSDAILREADLVRAKLDDCNASGADFSEAALNNAEMAGIDLNAAILKGASLLQANLKGALLDRVQLQQSILRECDLTEVQASKAILDEASLDQANLDGADFSQASLLKVSLIGASLRSTRFRNAVLEQADFKSAEGIRADFSGAKLMSAKLQQGQFSDADFSGADVSGADFTEADLTRANFTAAQAIQVKMRGANLTELRAGGGANFEQANLEQVTAPESVWMQSSLRQANLKWANMPRSNFNQTNLSDAHCVAADIQKADLTRANLKGADLRDCNFFESLFECANLTNTNFSGSNMYGSFFMDNVVEGDNLQQSQFNQTNLKRTRIEVWDET
jgi:uncharacterized protein YjbI with pentapeptide repeats